MDRPPGRTRRFIVDHDHDAVALFLPRILEGGPLFPPLVDAIVPQIYPVGKDRKRSDSVQKRTESSRGTQMVNAERLLPSSISRSTRFSRFVSFFIDNLLLSFSNLQIITGGGRETCVGYLDREISR